MLLFAVTGFTLNHPAWFQAERLSELREFELSQSLAQPLMEIESGTHIPPELARRLSSEAGTAIPAKAVPVIEYEEMILDLGGPGVDATLTVDLVTGEAFYERIDNGVIARLNDLHKGRDTGFVWGILIDITAIACIIFCISGLGLLAINAKVRASTWPLATLGVIVPVIAYILFVHV